MPNTRISALTAAVSVAGTDVVPSVQTAGVGPVKTSLDQIKTYTLGGAGTLPVGNGGTGLTTLTAGYIPFGAGTSAFNSSANLFWSSAANRLGVNTSSPARDLHVKAGGVSTFCVIVSENTNGGTNAKVWDFLNNGAGFSIRATNDAYNAAHIGYGLERAANDYTIAAHTWYTGASAEAMRLNPTGVGIGTSTPTAKLDVNSDVIRLRTAKTPATAAATGNAGDICWDSNYVYVCTAANTWKRAAIATW
jgi:hypothetical protein